MALVFIYILFIIVLTWLNRKDFSKTIFKSKSVIPWWLSGLSLYMTYLSVDQGQLITGVISRYGMQGMWIFWASWFGAFVVPIVFAPLWKNLGFITDNQFLLFRYPGKSGQILHAFRAFYVGAIVVSLAICFHLLGFARVASVYFNLNEETALILMGIVMCLYSLKNVFDIKVKTDQLHYFVFIIAFIIALGYVWSSTGGWVSIENFFIKQPDKKDLFPNLLETDKWFTLFVFVGIQWWSCYLFDGGGPEMARFTAVKDTKSAVLAGLLPIFISLVVSTLLLMQVLMILGGAKTGIEDQEKLYVTEIFLRVPEYLRGIIFLGFFGMFITTAEALMNWGASFLTVDLYTKYFNKETSGRGSRLVSFLSMLFLSLLATIFAFQVENLGSLIKITFSIAAGVAPVYILRWVWYRINAWSQLSAMLSSGVFTLLYPMWHSNLPLHQFPMEESRVIIVTIITSAIWLMVTFLTPDQSKEVEVILSPVLSGRRRFAKSFAIALVLGVFVLLLLLVFWKLILI
jgi:solute:Na+ symporter, SSS family